MSESLYSLIDNTFGVSTRAAENREDTSMSTTSSIVLRNDATRLAATIVNLGSNDVYVRPDGPASSSAGVIIAKNGGSLSLIFRDDFSLVGKEWQGATGSSTSTLYISEVLVEPDVNLGV